MKLIYADALMESMWNRCGVEDTEINNGRAKWESGLWIRYKVFEETLAEQPEAIVHCKDCKRYHRYENDYIPTLCVCRRLCDEFDHSMEYSVRDDDFCSYGEAKDDSIGVD